MPDKDCYQVKVHATMTNELRCLYEKLGTAMFQIIVLTEFADDIFLEETTPVPAPELNPEILEIEFDKCDPCKVIFTLYIELPRGVLNNPTVDFDPEDGQEDVRVLPVEHKLRTSGHLHPLEMNIFTVYPLTDDNDDGIGAVTSIGYETECYSYEQCRVPCKDDAEPQSPLPDPLPLPDSFRVIFPLGREVACLIPEFGLSGFYLKTLISTNLKTKVRLVSGNDPNAQIAAGLLTYDPEKCEAVLEVSENQDVYDEIVAGYEYLFRKNPTDSLSQPSLSEMATNRRYAVRGVSKCTEKDLFTFEICFKPSLVPLGPSNVGYMNYSIMSLGCEHWSYEFKNANTPAPQ